MKLLYCTSSNIHNDCLMLKFPTEHISQRYFVHGLEPNSLPHIYCHYYTTTAFLTIMKIRILFPHFLQLILNDIIKASFRKF